MYVLGDPLSRTLDVCNFNSFGIDSVREPETQNLQALRADDAPGSTGEYAGEDGSQVLAASFLPHARHGNHRITFRQPAGRLGSSFFETVALH